METTGVAIIKHVSSEMSVSNAVIDLSDDTVVVSEPSKKRKVGHERLEKVWIAFHQLEASYDCVGDFVSDRHSDHLSHNPTEFDKTILGIFVTRRAANICANEFWKEINPNYEEDEEEDDDDNVPDFVGEGQIINGCDSGNVNTFSQRVVVEMKMITHE